MYLRNGRLFGVNFCGVLIALVAVPAMAQPGARRTEEPVTLHRQRDSFSLGNSVISAHWSIVKRCVERTGRPRSDARDGYSRE